ncbi:MAG: hypothetical protein HRU20_26525 [Pseudomonadales bacterium]|nr:hypothetical protein [Pseudomonadales bacterium]
MFLQSIFKRSKIFPIAVSLALLIGCGGKGQSNSNQDNSGNEQSESVISVSRVFANAGKDRQEIPGSVVNLDASASSDSLGKTISVRWEQISGKSVVLDDETSKKPSFSMPMTSIPLEFELTVTNSDNVISKDIIEVVARPYNGDTVAPFSSPFTADYRIPLEGKAWDIVVDGAIAYVAMGENGLAVLDISDLNTPITLARLDTNGNAIQLSKKGNTLYLADSEQGLKIIDVSNPRSPAINTTLSFDDRVISTALDPNSNSLFVAAGDEGAHIIQTDNPTGPRTIIPAGWGVIDFTIVDDKVIIYDLLTHRLSTINGALYPEDYNFHAYRSINRSVFQDGYLYATPGESYFSTPETDGKFRIIDTVDGKVVGSLFIPELHKSNREIAVYENIVFISLGDVGVIAIDVSNKASPERLFSYNTAGYANGIDKMNNYLLVADGDNGILAIDTTSYDKLPSLAEFSGIPSQRLSLAADKGLVISGGDYASPLEHGVNFIDVSSTPSLSRTFQNDSHWQVSKVSTQGNYAYTSLENDGFSIYNIENPQLPFEVFNYNLDQTQFQAHVVQGDIAFVFCNSYSGSATYFMDVLDLSVPSSSSLVKRYDDIEVIFRTAPIISGSNLFLETYQGFRIFDISDVNNIIEREVSIEGYANIRDLAIYGDYVFASTVYGELISYDASDVMNIKKLSTIDMSSKYANQMDIKIVNDTLYAAANGKGIYAFDIRNPYSVGLIANYATADRATEIEVNNGIAYVADNLAGLRLIDVSAVSSISLNDYTNASKGEMLTYQVSWTDNNFPNMKCDVSGGQCSILHSDHSTKTAEIDWMLPDSEGDFEIQFILGDKVSYISAFDRVVIQ